MTQRFTCWIFVLCTAVTPNLLPTCSSNPVSTIFVNFKINASALIYVGLAPCCHQSPRDYLDFAYKFWGKVYLQSWGLATCVTVFASEQGFHPEPCCIYHCEMLLETIIFHLVQSITSPGTRWNCLAVDFNVFTCSGNVSLNGMELVKFCAMNRVWKSLRNSV